MKSLFCIVILVCTFLIDQSDGEKLPEAQCQELGFNSAELDCSRCLELKKFQLDSLKDSCMKCCRGEDSTNKKKKFAFARLEYCECNIANFPQIKAFIRGDKSKKYPNLKIKFVRGVLPSMKLLNEHHNVVEELNIQRWDTDTLEEYLDQHLS